MSAQPGCSIFVFVKKYIPKLTRYFLIAEIDSCLVDIYSSINLYIINALQPESFHPNQPDRTT